MARSAGGLGGGLQGTRKRGKRSQNRTLESSLKHDPFNQSTVQG